MEYQKIQNIYARDMEGTRKLLEGQYSCEEFEYLKNCMWDFTEKIDGTNIQVLWDGYTVSFQGRTEKSNIPKPLMEKLEEMFSSKESEQIFEQLFGETPAILFGEGYGEKIQKCGGEYIKGNSFILFDVFIGGYWLKKESISEIATALNINTVPTVLTGTLDDGVNFIKTFPKSTIGTADMEGIVGRPSTQILDRQKHRIIIKIKCCDFGGKK